MSIGMMLSPVIVGWSHDVWKTYDWSLYVLAGFCAAASVTVLFATRPMSPEVRSAVGGAAFEPLDYVDYFDGL